MFDHEQSVIIADNKTVHIGGCAHRGIVNIIDDAEQKTGKPIDVCISGFHLFNPATKATEEVSVIKNLANALKQKDTKFYTCHCTGTKAYNLPKAEMLDNVDYLMTGQTIDI